MEVLRAEATRKAEGTTTTSTRASIHGSRNQMKNRIPDENNLTGKNNA